MPAEAGQCPGSVGLLRELFFQPEDGSKMYLRNLGLLQIHGFIFQEAVYGPCGENFSSNFL
jgi:hypothetical protein